MIHSRRSGLTLIEVLLTMAIAAMVLAVLTQLQDSGVRAATSATLAAEASVLCQSEMDAWLAGGQPTHSLDKLEVVAGTEKWARRISLQSLPNSVTSSPEVASASVESRPSALAVLTVEIFRARKQTPEFTLSRWIATRESVPGRNCHSTAQSAKPAKCAFGGGRRRAMKLRINSPTSTEESIGRPLLWSKRCWLWRLAVR